jgi:succinate dehydrogenase / fumarate reductase cytochrome b subunit
MLDTHNIHKNRPLSPHLQVYKPQMTSILSILHRATGAALAIGTLMVTWWLIALASGPQAYEVFQGFAGSPLGIFMLFGWSFALFYHMTNGVRHLIWDTGRMFNIGCATRAGYVVLLVSVLATAGAWYCAYNF